MRLVVYAAVAIFAYSGVCDAQVKWVPLNQVQRGPPKPPSASAKPAAAQPIVTQATIEPPSMPVAQAEVSSPQVGSGPLQLTCFGAGTANKTTAKTAFSNSYISGNVGTTPFSGSGSGTTTVYGTRQQGFGDQVDVRLFSGDDRIRVPRTMLPPLHGGNAGWFKLKNVVA